jgi:predicted DNA-binding protein
MTVKNVKQIACYLTPKQHAALKRLSAASGAPVAYYLRLAVAEFLARSKRRAATRR